MSESKQYKLTYFNGRGLGEIARLLFAAAGVKYDDHRVEHAEWEKLKSSMPFEALPVLEADGVQIAQSQAIARFLAKRFNLFGSNDIEAAQIDAILEATVDLRQGIFGVMREKDPELKEKKLKDYIAGDLVKYTTLLEKNLAKNNEGKGWVVGDKMSVADVQIYNTYHLLLSHTQKPDFLKKDFPLLNGLVERVAAVPAIAEWVKNRPDSAF